MTLTKHVFTVTVWTSRDDEKALMDAIDGLELPGYYHHIDTQRAEPRPTWPTVTVPEWPPCPVDAHDKRAWAAYADAMDLWRDATTEIVRAHS